MTFARKRKRFRYGGDPEEITLHLSREEAVLLKEGLISSGASWGVRGARELGFELQQCLRDSEEQD